ncbi:MAG: alcohol dehydrogenase catalytic domain-containing protein [Sedimentisphaerales bacterium]|nr:alcohol dehydrogenase catalytic domain-containing protein [Sedimentisphaerales bacterium]
MKALALTAVKKLEFIEVPTPKIEKDTDVLLKTACVGICGSDIHYYEEGKVGTQVAIFPYIIGHECSAIVAQVGKAVKDVKVGDKVVVEPAVWCSECDQCKMGRENTCRKIQFLGTPGQGDGCLCEYMVMPEENCMVINDRLTLIQAALIEPFTIGLYSARQGWGPYTEKIAILGSGPIGLSCMTAARMLGAKKIYMTDKINSRCAFAKARGVDWTGNPDEGDIVKQINELEPLGIDVVYECAGQQSTIDEALGILRPGGKLVLVGIPRDNRISISIDQARRKEITIVNIRRQNRTTKDSIEVLTEGKVNVDFLATHKFPFADSIKAFELAAGYKDGVIKAMIEF